MVAEKRRKRNIFATFFRFMQCFQFGFSPTTNYIYIFNIVVIDEASIVDNFCWRTTCATKKPVYPPNFKKCKLFCMFLGWWISGGQLVDNWWTTWFDEKGSLNSEHHFLKYRLYRVFQAFLKKALFELSTTYPPVIHHLSTLTFFLNAF